MLKGLTIQVKALLIGAVLLLLSAALVWHLWQKSRAEGAQSRLDRGQTEALTNSARDAIAAQGEAAARERASEELTRTNEKEIRDAEGANDPVKAPVDRAGRAALCMRDAYRDSEQCRLLRADPR